MNMKKAFSVLMLGTCATMALGCTGGGSNEAVAPVNPTAAPGGGAAEGGAAAGGMKDSPVGSAPVTPSE